MFKLLVADIMSRTGVNEITAMRMARDLIKLLKKNKLASEEKKIMDEIIAKQKELNRQKEALRAATQATNEAAFAVELAIAKLKELIDLAALYEANKERLDAEAAADKLLQEYLAEVENMTGDDIVGTCNAPKGLKKAKKGKLARMLALYISINPDFMKKYKDLLDAAYKADFINGIWLITSIFGNLRPETSDHLTIDSVKRQIRILKTNHLNNQFSKDLQRLPFEEMTDTYLNNKFKI